MKREIEEWPLASDGYSDNQRKLRDLVVQEHSSGLVLPVFCEPASDTEDKSYWGELTITTDPTEAPADALLEGVGYYVEPGDRIQSLWSPLGMVHYHCRDGKTLGGHYDYELTGWDPYSWDVKRTTLADVVKQRDELKARLYELDFRKQAAIGGVKWTVENVVKPTTWFHKRLWDGEGSAASTKPCTVCNGSGQVAGALGVGLTWTCGECEGSGKC